MKEKIRIFITERLGIKLPYKMVTHKSNRFVVERDNMIIPTIVYRQNDFVTIVSHSFKFIWWNYFYTMNFWFKKDIT